MYSPAYNFYNLKKSSLIGESNQLEANINFILCLYSSFLILALEIFNLHLDLGCPSGDTSDWCKYSIRSSSEKSKCYLGNTAELCCATCQNYSSPDIPGMI